MKYLLVLFTIFSLSLTACSEKEPTANSKNSPAKEAVKDAAKQETNSTPENTKEKKASRIDKLSKALSLSEEQKPLVEAILKEAKTKREAIEKGDKEQNKALRKETRQKLSEVLSEEQLAAMDGMKKKNKEQNDDSE